MMLNREILFPLFDWLPFTEIFRMAKIDKFTWLISKSETYWRQRARKEHITYRSVTHDPRINYAWSVVKSLNYHDPSVYVCLSESKIVLFHELEEVIGLSRFLKRCIHLKDREMFQYGFSLGPSKNVTYELIRLSNETGWTEWKDNFGPIIRCRFDVHSTVNRTDSIKYLRVHMIHLLIKGEEEQFLKIYYTLSTRPDLYFVIGYYGSLSLIEEYTRIRVRVRGCSWIRYNFIVEQYGLILRGAVAGNRLDTVNGILDHISKPIDLFDSSVTLDTRKPKMTFIFEIRSYEMYDLLNRSGKFYDYVLIRGVILGGNYHLLFQLLPTFKKKNMKKAFSDRAVPIILRLMMKWTDRVTNMERHSLIETCPFQYNALRRLGMSKVNMTYRKSCKMFANRSKITVPGYLNLDLLPMYREDVNMMETQFKG